MEKKIFRSKTNKQIFGVCGGFGEFFDIDPTIIRILVAFFTFFYGFGLIAYLIGAVTIPEK
jgi:phage shock protein PspC (stress-responsive transcriptional regulator)